MDSQYRTDLIIQPTIALVYDCDKTLSPEYMQEPVFRKYGINGSAFWKERDMRISELRKRGHKTSKELGYLNQMVRYAKRGDMKGLSNAVLRECGKDLQLFEGLPDFFGRIKGMVEKNGEFARHGIKLKHYIVSTGLTEVISGSVLAKYVDGVYACEFSEDEHGEIAEVVHYVSPTEKTRMLFEISKGDPDKVDARVPKGMKVVPFENMVYFGDGPSDVPCFSVVKDHGGICIAVYEASVPESLGQCVQLSRAQRIDTFGPADYREGSHISQFAEYIVEEIAKRIVSDRDEAMEQGVVPAAVHLDIGAKNSKPKQK